MLKSIYKKIFLLTLLFSFAKPVMALEYIDTFNSNIEVHPKGYLTITETITVYHEGDQIKRGIYRDLSTLNKERYHIRYITRDDNDEPFSLKKTKGNLRINIGDDTLLPAPAFSTYVISYDVYDVLRPIINKNLNELYYNITGKWNFPINKVTINVSYPENTQIISRYGYQGNHPAEKFTDNQPFVFQNLLMNQEVTIAEAFEKGTVNVPLPRTWYILISGFIVTLIYFFIAWFLWGKDPKSRPIVPDWEVPDDLTPLECAYINNNGNEPKNSFFIHILWLLSRHVIKITTSEAPGFLGKTKWYTLTTQEEADKTEKEIKLYCTNYPNVLTLTDKPNEKLTEYCRKLITRVQKKLENHFYLKRTSKIFLGAAILPLFFLWAFNEYLSAEDYYCLFFIPFYIIPLTLSNNFFIHIHFMFVLLITLHLTQGSPYLLVLFSAYFITLFIFNRLMFQPTALGQKYIEKIEGIKMFLKTITKNKAGANETETASGLNMGKRLTPLDMEKLFPYAVALGLEEAWSKKYADVFGNAALANCIKNNNFYQTKFRNHVSSYCTTGTSFAKSTSTHSSGMGSFGGGCAGGGFGGGGGGGR